jgi:hypothetical protein
MVGATKKAETAVADFFKNDLLVEFFISGFSY